MLLSFLVQAEPVVEELGNAGIHDAVVNMTSMSPGREDAHVHKAPKLVGHCRRLHTHGFGEVTHAGITLNHQSVKQTESCFRSQHSKQALKRPSLHRIQKGSGWNFRFRRTDGWKGGGHHGFTISHISVMLRFERARRNSVFLPKVGLLIEMSWCELAATHSQIGINQTTFGLPPLLRPNDGFGFGFLNLKEGKILRANRIEEDPFAP